MTKFLQNLVEKTKLSIKNEIYEINTHLSNSDHDLEKKILGNKNASLITEIKFSSPSEGKIRKITDPVLIAKSMIDGGAVGLSVLTQPYFFNGSPDYFMQIRKNVKVPMLMKDIIIDFIQIEAAKKMGADFILLIQSVFDNGLVKNIENLIDFAHKKGLKVLIESHTKKEFENAQGLEADLLGINNRNLDTLKIDLKTTKNLLKNHDKKKLIISESGIKTKADILFLQKCGADAFLVGSNIMKSSNIEQKVQTLVKSI